jgi:hypothetical protein
LNLSGVWKYSVEMKTYTPELDAAVLQRPSDDATLFAEGIDAVNAMQGFIHSGLFMGQPDEFTDLLQMAAEADQAHR